MLPAMHQPTRCAGVAANGSTLKRAIIRVNRVIKPVVACATSSSTDDYDALREVRVLSAANGADVELTALLGRPEGQELVLVPFLTHFADLSSWEFAQKLNRKVLPRARELGVRVVTVGLGSPENARGFARTLNYPLADLYADPAGAAYEKLGFSPGFAPDVDISPYAKLLPMLAGIGSPGTMQEVIRGYIGDRDAPPVFDAGSPFDVLGGGYQRPFELASLRLLNMAGILPRWGELSPPDSQLLVRQGGALLLRGGRTLYRHADPGILRYADVDELLRACEQAVANGASNGLSAAPLANAIDG